MRWRVSAPTTATFAAATVSKALEPLAVGYSSDGARGSFPYSVGWAIVTIELVKLVVCAAALLVQLRGAGPQQRAALVRLDGTQLARLAIPGLLLALTNWGMFAALALLDPLLYQIVIKAVIISATAALSYVLLRKQLASLQWGALLGLFLGCLLATVPDMAALSAAAAASTVRGLWLAAAASIAFALQAVYFELVSNEAEGEGQSVWWQSIQAGVYGVLANVALLALFGDVLGSGAQGPAGCFGLGRAGNMAVLAVSAADITMNLACKTLGANAYNFARAGSFLLSAAAHTVWMGAAPSAHFCAGAAIVMAAGDRYQRAERASNSLP